jgi:ABC-type multidrug transport system fused ATPase/permease subunit
MLPPIAVIWFGGKMVPAGEMGTGELISFLSYLMMILISAMMFSMAFILFARAKACAQRVLEVLDTGRRSSTGRHWRSLKPTAGN